MNIIKKIFSFIFNPFNTMIGEKTTNKVTEGFSKHAILTFIVALIVTAIIYVLCYFVIQGGI